jgi:hypothetical protein
MNNTLNQSFIASMEMVQLSNVADTLGHCCHSLKIHSVSKLT